MSLRDLGLVVVGAACGFTWARAVLRSRGAPDALTKRQRAILMLVGQGLSTKEIAREIGITPHSVNTHIRRAMRNLAVSTRAEAIAVVLGTGQAGTPSRPRRSATTLRALTTSPTSSSNGI